MTHARFRAGLDDFLAENLSASARAEMAAHLESCAACAALKNQREADLRLSRAALSELLARPAPPELRLRVRAAIQDEQAAVAARSAQRKWFPARAMRASAWSGTLVFGALALLIWARPFAQMPLGSPPETASETASETTITQAPVGSNSQAKPVAPLQFPLKNRQPKAAQPPVLPSVKTQIKTQNGVARPQKPAPATRTQDSTRADATPMSAPDGSRSNSVFDSNSTASATAKAPAAPSPRAPKTQLAQPPQPQASTPNLEAPGALPDAAARPNRSPNRADAPKIAADASQNSTAKTVAPDAARRSSLRARAAPSPLAAPLPALPATAPELSANLPREMNGALSQNRAASATADFDILISEAAPEPNRTAVLGSIPMTGGLFRSLPNQSAGSFGARGGGFSGAGGRGGAPDAAPPAAPNSPAAAPQFSTPQQATTPAMQSARGSAFGVVPGGAQNEAEKRASALENQVGAAVIQRWTVTIVSPRAVEGAIVRVDLPPSLRVGDAAEATFRGDLAPNRAVILRFSTRGARGGEKISVIVEQNGGAAQSKPAATRILALPTPK